MSIVRPKSAYFRGFVASLPFTIMASPFGLLFGVVATEAGLNLLQVMGFTVVVIAGAAQFTAVQLMVDGAPTLVVLISALAVNLRMMMYSAALQPHLGAAPLWQRVTAAYTMFDQTYALAQANHDAAPEASVADKAAFYLGAATPLVPVWILSTWLGAVLGAQIPEAWALDFAMPIMFLAMIAPALRSLAHVAAAVTAVSLALIFAFLPFNLGLMVAALPAMAVGAELERRGYGR
ncbi:MAG: AzlC family ABC transporter permease [Pseudomonadota bacterium]